MYQFRSLQNSMKILKIERFSEFYSLSYLQKKQIKRFKINQVSDDVTQHTKPKKPINIIPAHTSLGK